MLTRQKYFENTRQFAEILSEVKCEKMGSKPDPLINAAWRYLIGPLISIWWIFAYVGVALAGLCTVAVILIFIFLYIKFKVTKSGVRYPNELVIGFFHPYCDAGGGGERVLWCGIRAIQKGSFFLAFQKILVSNFSMIFQVSRSQIDDIHWRCSIQT